MTAYAGLAPEPKVNAKWKGSIERALGSWEAVDEWADYIAFLSRVHKAVKNKPSGDTELPLASQISQYLSRCLEPSLPAGVHQTALEVYDSVFTIIGPQELYQNMNIWLPGLLPVLSYAAFNVKPLILKLIENHILPCPSLRELCRPLLLSCFPSIEDVGGECFQETLDLIQSLRSRINDDMLFWQCLMLCVVTSEESRLGSLIYCQRYLPTFEAKTVDGELVISSDAKMVVSPEPGIFLRALVYGLQDNNVLVQRGFLDILDKNLPLDSPVITNCANDDIDHLMMAATRTVRRRDMSLNRRLWTWLCGPGPNSQPLGLKHLDYFKVYGADSLTKVLLDTIQGSKGAALCEAFKVAHGIMDRYEIGSVVVPQLLTPILRSTQREKSDPAVIQAGQQFFKSIEGNHIWKVAFDLISSGEIGLVLFMVSTFDISEEDMDLTHIPLILLTLLSNATSCTLQSDQWQELAVKLLDMLQPVSLAELDDTEPVEDVTVRISEYYQESVKIDDSGYAEKVKSPLSPAEITATIAAKLQANYCEDDSRENLKLLQLFLGKLPTLRKRMPELIRAITYSVRPDAALFAALHSTMSPLEILNYAENFTTRAFDIFIAAGQEQVELTRDLWLVHETCGGYIVPSALATVFSNNENVPVSVARAFSVLWLHSVERSEFVVLLGKPTMLFLDMLSSKDTSTALIARLYLRTGVIQTGTVDKLLRLLLDTSKAVSGDYLCYEYHLNTLLRILEEPEIKRMFRSRFSDASFDFMLSWMDGHQSVMWGPFGASLAVVANTYMEPGYDITGPQIQKIVRFVEPLVKNAERSSRMSYSLVEFVARALPLLPFETNVNFSNKDSLAGLTSIFLKRTIGWVDTDIDFIALSNLLDQFLSVFHRFIPQIVLPLVDTLVKRLGKFDGDIIAANLNGFWETDNIVQLLTGCEKVLVTGLKVLYSSDASRDESLGQGSTPSQLLGNVISGVFSVESPSEKSAVESGRSMLLEAINLVVGKCCDYWAFLEQIRKVTMKESQYSTTLHSTGRLKTRLRKLTSMLYRNQPAETIQLAIAHSKDIKIAVKMTHMFEGSQFKGSVKVIVDEITSRFDPKKTETEPAGESGLSDTDLLEYLVAYIQSLEPDASEDVWGILMGFLNDVNSKSSAFAPILLSVLSLCIVMVNKLDRANYGQQKRIRKDFSDVFQKLILSTLSDVPQAELLGLGSDDSAAPSLIEIVPAVPQIIPEQERQSVVLSKVLTATIAPSFKNTDLSSVPLQLFALLETVIEHSANHKAWKPIVGDLIFDPRLFTLTVPQSKALMPVVERWVQVDKERMTEFLSRIANYGSNSVLFGWSNSQKLTDENLDRLAYITLCSENIGMSYPKLVNQLSTIWNNGSIVHTFTLLRATVFKREQSQLTSIYSFLTFKLQELFCQLLEALLVVKTKDSELRDPEATEQLLAASKLLDLVLTLNSDQFQYYEWLFVCDSTDAIYPHEEERAGDVVDKLASARAITRIDAVPYSGAQAGPGPDKTLERRPILPPNTTLRDLHQFYNQLSVSLYEALYSMSKIDYDYCRDMVLSDLFVGKKADSS